MEDVGHLAPDAGHQRQPEAALLDGPAKAGQEPPDQAGLGARPAHRERDQRDPGWLGGRRGGQEVVDLVAVGAAEGARGIEAAQAAGEVLLEHRADPVLPAARAAGENR